MHQSPLLYPSGPQSHSLSPLSEAYRSKLAALQAAVNGGLLARREALLQQHARLAARAGEVAAARAALERDISVGGGGVGQGRAGRGPAGSESASLRRLRGVRL